MKVNNLSIKKRLIPYLQLRSHWEQKYIKQLVKSFFRHKKNNAVIIIDAIKCLTSFKWVKKCFWRIKEEWKEEAVKEEAVKGFAAFTVHSTSIKILCSLRNKDGARIKIKNNIFLLKTYLTQIKRKLLVMKAPLPVQLMNNHMILKKSILQVYRIRRYLLKKGWKIIWSLTYPMESLRWYWLVR